MRFLLVLTLLFSLQTFASDSTRLYNPYANVQKDVAEAVAKAKRERKHVLIQVGGNWCTWCYSFNSFIFREPTLKALVENNYVLYHLNYSKENRNLDYLKKLGFPQRFGFPVLVVLDENGNRIHTQDCTLLEKDHGYDFERIKSFFINWAPLALQEANYRE